MRPRKVRAVPARMPSSDSPPHDSRVSTFSLDGETFAVLSAPKKVVRAHLTAAESAVAKLLMEGLSNEAISRRRGSSIRTVANQVQAILRKYGVSSRYELIAHLVDLDD